MSPSLPTLAFFVHFRHTLVTHPTKIFHFSIIVTPPPRDTPCHPPPKKIVNVHQGTHNIPSHVLYYSPMVLKFQRIVSSTVPNTPHGTHDIFHVHHDIPHSTEHPMVLKITPTVLMISPTILNTSTVLKISPHLSWYLRYPHGTQDLFHVDHDIPHSTEHPMVLKITPTVLMISPTILNTSTVLKISPHLSWYTRYPHDTQDIPPQYSWYPPMVLNTPTVLSSPTVLHTHYTGCWFSRLVKNDSED